MCAGRRGIATWHPPLCCEALIERRRRMRKRGRRDRTNQIFHVEQSAECTDDALNGPVLAQEGQTRLSRAEGTDALDGLGDQWPPSPRRRRSWSTETAISA